MDDTLRQVGELLLGALPTLLLVTLLYVAYRNIVHVPLVKTLAERHSKTQGAIERAKSDVAAADERTADYEQRIRDARTAIYKAQEARRQQIAEARSAALQQARQHSDAQVKAARATIAAEAASARNGLEGQSEMLAAEVIRTVLKPAGASSGSRP